MEGQGCRFKKKERNKRDGGQWEGQKEDWERGLVSGKMGRGEMRDHYTSFTYIHVALCSELLAHCTQAHTYTNRHKHKYINTHTYTHIP